MSMRPFQLRPDEKQQIFLEKMVGLTKHHITNCQFYNNFLSAYGFEISAVSDLSDIPYLPARFFKEFTLNSGSSKPNAIATSSGTNGQVSKIALSHKTMLAQSMALNSIVKSFIGKDKLPMLIFEKPNLINNKLSFNARAAGVMGFSKFGSEIFFVFDKFDEIDFGAIDRFNSLASDTGGLAFGFTSTVWEVLRSDNFPKIGSDYSAMKLIHGGGWKKLAALNISDNDFNSLVSSKINRCTTHNYYGMVEQTGSIFFECETGRMHASSFSEVIVRDVETLAPLEPGKVGVIQVLSSLPESYPGHSILTEDLGIMEADCLCECGRFGSIVKVLGRLPEAEVRGCSDVY
jgi:phenylacetate-coenzyme A ligase PaaK-like adenylate-forming protein